MTYSKCNVITQTKVKSECYIIPTYNLYPLPFNLLLSSAYNGWAGKAQSWCNSRSIAHDCNAASVFSMCARNLQIEWSRVYTQNTWRCRFYTYRHSRMLLAGVLCLRLRSQLKAYWDDTIIKSAPWKDMWHMKNHVATTTKTFPKYT